ncbi:MAG TPA: hypothetical protein VGY77_06535 [Gemmataceae bacterium]|nr:hypothetical protein [Gemmataceae bacterium]
MTRKQSWMVISALALALLGQSSLAQCKKEACAEQCDLLKAVCDRLFQTQDQCCCEELPCPNQGCCAKEAAAKDSKKHGTITLGAGLTVQPGIPLVFPFPMVEVQAVNTQPVCGSGCLFGSCPSSDACVVGDVTPSDAKVYIVETRVVEAWPGEKETVLCCPRLTILEGAPATVSLHDGGIRSSTSSEKLSGRLHCTMKVQVQRHQKDLVMLDISVQHNKIEKSGQKGTIVLGHCLEAIQEMKLRQKAKLALDKDDRGGARAWIEVTVQEAQEPANQATQATMPMPQQWREYPHQPPCYSAVPQGALMAADKIYLPQPTAPVVAPPVPIATPPFCPAPCMEPIYPIMPCVAPEPMPAPADSPSIFRAIKCQGEAQLEMINGAEIRLTCKDMAWNSPGCRSLKISTSADQVQLEGDALKASANRVIVGKKDHLVMEGHVRLSYAKNRDQCQITAEKVILNLTNGNLEIISQAKSNDEREQIFSFWLGHFH